MSAHKANPVIKNEVVKEKVRELILYNDEVNTFDCVIETLIDVCGHDPVQAEQCTLIAHYKGKCGVKSGTLLELRPVKNELITRKLTVSIK